MFENPPLLADINIRGNFAQKRAKQTFSRLETHLIVKASSAAKPQDEKPNVCTDLYDGKKHPIGSHWNTAHCKECWCSDDGMQCCDRFGGIAVMEGCISVVDPETCKYKFYKEDDPSTLCTF
nr:small serum protein 5-like [Anolis sagrei ordinatus]